MKKQISYQKYAVLFCLLLLLILILSCCFILFSNPSQNTTEIYADIYQEGVLLESIALHQVSTPYTFTITGKNQCQNTIEIRKNSIGIIEADCPDKLCVKQGFISTSILPITCLPNQLVIQIRQETSSVFNSPSETLDAISY